MEDWKGDGGREGGRLEGGKRKRGEKDGRGEDWKEGRVEGWILDVLGGYEKKVRISHK